MKQINIAVIGSGSVFTPELVTKLSEISPQIGRVSLRFMDIDHGRQEAVAMFCRRLLEKRGRTGVEITCFRSVEECVDSADFILLQLRQGGIDARIEDERLGKRYKIPFTETISICGLSTFLRTYYEYERLAVIIRKRAPDAWILNFTNPAGQLSEALDRLGLKKVIGICNAFMGIKKLIEKTLRISDGEYIMNWRGLNHLTVVDGIYHDGRNRFQELLELLPEDPNGFSADKGMLTDIGALLNGYFQYYFDRNSIVEKQQRQPMARSESVKDIDLSLLAEYETAAEIPQSLEKRGGCGYSTAVVNVLKAICLNEGSVHYAVVKNGSALPILPRDAFVEVPVMVNREGPFPLVMDELPPFAAAMVFAMKTYERELIAAAMRRDKALILRAMMVHPLLNCYSVAKPLLEDCLAINREFVPEIT